MTSDLIKLKNDKDRDIFFRKREIVKLYKNGCALGEICRISKLDISSVLLLLKSHKFKKRSLYQIYVNQSIRAESKNVELVLKRDKYYLEKYFPNSGSDFSSSYYWFWRESFKKGQEKQKICSHRVRHIRCSLCNKILKDATNIPLVDDQIIITKI